MPIYTYRCENCGVQFERAQKFDDLPLTWCPECKKKALRKVYTPVGIVFKGSGFYSTDHRSPSGANRLKDTTPAPASSSDEKPAETKPAAEKPATSSPADARKD